MEWTKPSELPAKLQAEWTGALLKVKYTQWEDEDLDADESQTEFEAILLRSSMSKNDVQGLDGSFTFQSPNDEETMEILMDFPMDGEDVVALFEGNHLTLFGNEATLVMQK
ncbi:hypothetical protein [Ammoniphilus sp. YIM 78166]|uniref:hypothetical protein n=1 Tax=Ammoniphilus sp. YIM 78166 TaxID=1644106 RepID=UPI0010705339|nr:hypothetical protein [Ammoniphilus sp. YIM 78166]